MEKNEGVVANSNSWLDQIKAEYNVDHEDFTTHYPDGIIVFRGSSTPPNVAFSEGFKRSSDPIWIEDSRYLLKDPSYVHCYVQQQVNLNRTQIPDQEHGQIVPPGANRGLISTTLSSKKAAWYVSQGFLEKAKALASNRFIQVYDNNLNANMCIAYLEGYFGRTCEVHEPIGYIYALRIKQGINISAHFQWADLPDPNFIEQEIACLEIPGVDVIFARPVYMNLVPGRGLVCTPGELIQNQNVSTSLQPLFTLMDKNDVYLEIGFDKELENYKTTKHAGLIGLSASHGGFIFSHHPDEPISLDEGNFSKFFIKPHIAPTQINYLAKLRERLNHLESAEPTSKRSKTLVEPTTHQEDPNGFTDEFVFDPQFDDDIDIFKKGF